MKISIIVAMDQKRGIGKNNTLMWKIPGELKRFKEITMGHPIIMGRKTFESIGRVLPGRVNIIITRDLQYHIEGAVIVHSLEQALKVAKVKEKNEIFIIGGGQIFNEALPLTDRLYLTLVEGDFGADTFFPDYSDFKKKISEEKGEAGAYKYTFLTLEKNN